MSTEIEVFNIAKTSVNRDEVRRWLTFLGVSEDFEIPDDGGISQPALLIALAGKRCFDDKTEILTDEGWKLFKDLSQQERVLTFNPITGGSEWQQPHGYLADDYSGSMIVAEGRDLSMAVTPEHRVFGRPLKRVNEPNRFVLAEQLLGSVPFCVPLTLGEWVGETPDEIRLPDYVYTQRASDQICHAVGTQTRTRRLAFSGKQVPAFAKLLAYYVTEGTADHIGDDIRSLSIYGDHQQEVRQLCDTLGLKHSDVIDPRNGCPKMRIGGGRQLARYVAQQCGKLSYEKHLPRWVLDLPKDELVEIWNILVATDGTVTERGQELVQSTSKLFVDQMQELLVKIGSATSLSISPVKHRPGAKIQSRRDSYYARRKAGRFAVVNNWNSSAQAERRHYTGQIYCVSTRNGVVCVRRDGKVFWSGNCYKSFEVSDKLNPNVTKIRKDWADYLDNILKSGHGSVLEHSVFTFAIENVSRVFTAEMNRHRAGWAISEGSLRFIRFGENVPYVEPQSIRGEDVLDRPEVITLQEFDYASLEDILTRETDNVSLKLAFSTVEAKKHATRILFARHFDNMREWYRLLEIIWADELKPTSTFAMKKHLTSLFRRGIGLGVATGGTWSGNIRALRHVIAMRCSPEAEEEICVVFSKIGEYLRQNEPMLFGDFARTDKGFLVPKYPKV